MSIIHIDWSGTTGKSWAWGHLVVVLISYVCSYLILSVWASMISICFYSVCQCPGPGSVLNPKWLSDLIGINFCCYNINEILYFLCKAPTTPQTFLLHGCPALVLRLVVDLFVLGFIQCETISSHVFQMLLQETQIWKGSGCLLTSERLPGALLVLYHWLMHCLSKSNSRLSLESQVPKRTIILHFVKWFLQSFGMLA